MAGERSESLRFEQMFPAFGFFGVGPRLSVVANVDETVSAIRISLDSLEPEFLNVEYLEIRGGDGELIDIHDLTTCEASSDFAGSVLAPSGLLKGHGFHSGLERNPWWQLRFQHPTHVDRIEVFNRADTFGSRSRSLRIEVLTTDGALRRLWAASSWREMFENIGALRGLLQDSTAFDDNIGNWSRRDILSQVADVLCTNEVFVDVRWRRLISMLDVWGEGVLSSSELRIIAAFALGADRTSIRELMFLSGSLARRSQLVRFETELLALSKRVGRDEVSLTRHGVGPILHLIPDGIDGTLRLLSQLVADLDELSLEPQIAYGTLLGAVRGQSVIEGDDDVDLLFRIDAMGREDAEDAVAALADLLVERGYTAKRIAGSLNMHVGRGGSLHVDVFPFWVKEEQAHLHMSYMEIDAIPVDVLLPRSTVQMHGATWPAANRPEEFLRRRYGEDWRVENRFFEWPWMVTE